MPSPAERSRNNIRAGIFVTVTLLLGLIVMIVLTDAIEGLSRSTRTYTVIFEVSSGVANLKPGSEVRVGGVPMGEVLEITPQLPPDDAFRKIAVDFTVDRKVTLYADAHVVVTGPLIGAEAWLDIPNVGDPMAGQPPGGQIEGISSPGMLTSLLGSENAAKADEMVENVRQFSTFLASVQQQYNERFAPTLDDLGAAASDVRAVTSDLREKRWESWAASIDRVMADASKAAAELSAAASDGRAVIAENREPIRSSIANIQQATNTINEQTLEKFHAMLETGQQGLDQARAVLTEMHMDYAGWSTNIGEVLADANLAAQQLKLTIVETRRSPWKLLYRPTADELEHELLYEAARSFAVAAAELRAASESVQSVLDRHGDKIAANEDVYRRLERNLIDSLANYEKAQQQLLDVIVSDRQK